MGVAEIVKAGFPANAIAGISYARSALPNGIDLV
jgi:hypothetical protein